jgi:hypothetical protein
MRQHTSLEMRFLRIWAAHPTWRQSAPFRALELRKQVSQNFRMTSDDIFGGGSLLTSAGWKP